MRRGWRGDDGFSWWRGGGDERDGGDEEWLWDDDDGVRLRWPTVEVVLWWDGDGRDEGDGGVVVWKRLAEI
ncbi:hypothetical protein Tco_1042133 [Tanacetum coccineum]|uniref:Uncharacterized protein n=1 Tax=Tanacetum coccineum TaxID=301880 RepID=A0ABQ5GIY9_9ASTR